MSRQVISITHPVQPVNLYSTIRLINFVTLLKVFQTFFKIAHFNVTLGKKT